MSICWLLFTFENEVRAYWSGKFSCASQKASLQDQTTVSKKGEDNKLLKETIGQRETNVVHKADDWDHVKGSAENLLIFTKRPDWNIFLSSNPA